MFSSIAVLTLALGIGANTAIFTLMDTVMLRLLPVDRPEELVQVLRVNPARGPMRVASFTNALWEQVRDHQDVFSSAFAWSSNRFNLSQGGAVHYANGVFVSGKYFEALGVRPAAGRLLAAADDQRGCPAVAVLSYSFWQDRFGGARSALSSTLSLDKHPFQVVGVSALGFYGMEVGNKFDVAIPVCSAAAFDGKTSRLDERSWWWLSIAGRAKPGVSSTQLMARLAVLSRQVFSGALPPDWGVEGSRDFLHRLLVSAPADTGVSELRSEFKQPLAILMGGVGLVLLIASANLASLMFARANARSREIAVRKALGASRGRLIRQLLTECLLLSCAGALLGLLFARWGTAMLVSYISTAQSPVFLDLSPDVGVFGFTACIAILTGVLFGVLPALRSTRVSLTVAMKGTQAEAAEEHRSFRPRSGAWMVASQIALSLVLVVVAGLFLRSLTKLLTLDIGFDRTNVLIVSANMPTANDAPEQNLALYDDFQKRLETLPGVVSVGRSHRIPISQSEWSQPIEVDSPNPPKGDDAEVYFNFVSPGYFRTLRTPLLAGRDFNQGDTNASVSVAIVNESFARKFFPNADPVGKIIRRIEGPTKPATRLRIVGLVKDSKYESLREETFRQAFFPISQMREGSSAGFFEVRTDRHPAALIPAVQNAAANVNKEMSLDYHSLAEQIDDSLVQERLLATLSAFFGALALLLATIGLYGIFSYLVVERQAEFGIRMALGAPPASILRLVMSDVAIILVAGTSAGVAISLLTVHVVQKLLYGVNARDTKTMIGAVLALCTVALIAGYLPARRAMKVDPMASLRYE
jgi:predicted permease